jgi:PAS domain S-box-containing protein
MPNPSLNSPSEVPPVSGTPGSGTPIEPSDQEADRLAALRRYHILDTPAEPGFDRITALAARLFQVPIALVSLVDASRAWFKSAYGFTAQEVDREATICSFAILTPEILVIPDTRQDPRLDCNVLVHNQPGIGFYAGAPLITSDGYNLGTLCLLDTRSRPDLSVEQRATLTDLAALVVDELELRLASRQVAQIDAALLQVTQGSATTTGEAFFQSLVHHFTQVLGVAYTYIGLVHGQNQESLQTIAVCAEGQIAENFEYRLQGTPCEQVLQNRGICIHPHNVQAQFPTAPLLAPLQIESYAAIPFFDLAGVPIGLLGVMHTKPLEQVHLVESLLGLFAARVATELRRQQAEVALVSSESRYRTLANAVPQIMWVNAPDGTLIFCNDRWSEYMGFQPELYKTLSWGTLVHPDEVSELVQTRTQAIALSTPYEVKCRLRRGDGVYRWQLVRVVPLRDSQGQVISWFGTATDIEEIKQAEAGQRFLSAASSVLTVSLDYQSTLEGITQLAVPFLADYCFFDLVATDGTWQRVAWHHGNPAQEGGFDRATQFVPPRAAQQHPVAKALLQGEFSFAPQVTDGDLQAVAIDAEHLDYLRSLELQSYLTVPLKIHHRVLGALTLCFSGDSGRHHTETDLSIAQELAQRAAFALENAQLYRQAQEANRVKDEFLAVLSHELRTPLNPILGWTRLLKSGRCPPDKAPEALETIERNAKLQTQLIEDLLDISRILSGKLSITPVVMDLNAVIRAAIETVQLAAGAKGIEIQAVFPPDSEVGSATVVGDPARLQQVVWNLLSNAVKFTPPGGQVTIRLSQPQHQAQIQVIDTGKGIAADFLPYVFETFRQADSSTTRTFGGLGLGLAIVRQLVELHGGTVAVDSQGEGQGATFTVRLPLTAQDAPAAAAPGHPPTAPDLRGLKILVVDDDLDSREFVCFVLVQAGASVTGLASGAAALRAIAQTVPDLLISDIGIADMDGYSLIRKIRDLPASAGGAVPAIALTAYAGDLDRHHALAAGFQAHFSKPTDVDAFVRAIVALTQAD